MGTVLLLDLLQANTDYAILFQSPSRWGRCCFGFDDCNADVQFRRFSPLLDGDGVASE